MSLHASYAASITDVAIHLPAGRIIITADDTATAITVTVSALHPDDTAATEAADATRITHDGHRLTIGARPRRGTGGVHIDGAGGVTISGNASVGTIIGAVIGGTGNTGSITGSITGTTRPAAATPTDPAPALLVEVTVPPDVRVRIDTDRAAVQTRGWLRRIDITTISGPVGIDAARLVDVETTSGPVTATITADGTAIIDTVTADIDIHTPEPVSIFDVRTASGRIRRTGHDAAEAQS